MIKIIRQPINVFPNNTVIDANNDINYSFTFSGDVLYDYTIDHGGNGNNLTKVSSSSPIYNNDSITHISHKSEHKIDNSSDSEWWHLYLHLPDFNQETHTTLGDTAFGNKIYPYLQQYDLVQCVVAADEDADKSQNKKTINVRLHEENTQLLNEHLATNGNLYIADKNGDLGAWITEISYDEATYKHMKEETLADGSKEEVFDYYLYTLTFNKTMDRDITKDKMLYVYKNYLKSPPYYYHAFKTPEITITMKDDNDNTLTGTIPTLSGRKCSFGADVNMYQQSIKYYQFDIYKFPITNGEIEWIEDNKSQYEHIYSTDKTYSSNVQCKYDGFIGEKGGYAVQLSIVTNHNILLQSPVKTFFVEYETPNSELAPRLEIDYEKQAINVSWIENKQSFPVVYQPGKEELGVEDKGQYKNFKENYPFMGVNCANIDNGFQVKYDKINGKKLDINKEDFTLFVRLNMKDVLNDDPNGGQWGDGSGFVDPYSTLITLRDTSAKYPEEICVTTYTIQYRFNSNRFVAMKYKTNGNISMEATIVPEQKPDGKPLDLMNDQLLFVIKPNSVKIYPTNCQMTWDDLHNAQPSWSEFEAKVSNWERFNEVNLFKEVKEV